MTSRILSATPLNLSLPFHRSPPFVGNNPYKLIFIDTLLSLYTVTFLLPISPLWPFWHVPKMVSTHAPQFQSIKPLMLRNLLQTWNAFAQLS
jgi:hypothetical protein